MKFTKMQGLGNDYLYVYSNELPKDPKKLSIKLSDRHFGAGSDGMIYILPSASADFEMRIFNADGSEAKMCGNGIRCVGKYVYEKGYTNKTELKIETLSGIKDLRLIVKDGKVLSVTVKMGTAKVFDTVTLGCADNIKVIPVDMGNPHAVVFCDDANGVPIETLGKKIGGDPFFKDGANVEFVSVTACDTLRMRVFERGSGVTLACGTGACAAVSAAVKSGLIKSDTKTKVILDGGTLFVSVSADFLVTMEGAAEFVYEGEVKDAYDK